MDMTTGKAGFEWGRLVVRTGGAGWGGNPGTGESHGSDITSWE